jgi:abortive infection bacteriophage resistance protein
VGLIILKDLQIPISIETQIQNLIDKNLIITNVEFAKSFLIEVSYYRFIKAYSLGLKDEEGNYKENISFEIIADLYNFNTHLRQILFPIIEYVEISLRCKVSNYFSLKHGNLGYKSPSNFNNIEYFNIFTQELSNEISRNKTYPT